MTPCLDVHITCNCFQWCPRKLKINCAGCTGDDVTPVRVTNDLAVEIFEARKNVEQQVNSKIDKNKNKCAIL